MTERRMISMLSLNKQKRIVSVIKGSIVAISVAFGSRLMYWIFDSLHESVFRDVVIMMAGTYLLMVPSKLILDFILYCQKTKSGNKASEDGQKTEIQPPS